MDCKRQQIERAFPFMFQKLALTLIALLSANFALQAQPEVANGSFATPNIGACPNYVTAPPGASWMFTSAGITTGGCGQQYNAPQLPSGAVTQAAFIQVHGSASGCAQCGGPTTSLSQSVSGFVSGHSYVITFYAAGRAAGAGCIAPDNCTELSFSVLVGSMDVLDVVSPPTNAFMQYTTNTFTASGTATIAFTATGPSGDDETSFIALVSIQDLSSSSGQNPQPMITSLSPASAFVGSGPLSLAINGSGFTAASSVTFNGISHSVSFINSSQLTITLTVSDVATAGTFAAVVTNPSPGGGTSNTALFTVTTTHPLPAITGLSPSYATVGSSWLTLTINGNGFISASSVSFNSVPHTASYINSGQLTILLSTSDLSVAGSFSVQVTNTPPGGGSSKSASFNVTVPQPSINAGGVVNVASYAKTVAPGGIAAAFGNFLLNSSSTAAAVPWPISLAGLSMQFSDGIQVPLTYASNDLVDFQVPWELAGQSQGSLTATVNGQTGAAQAVALAAFSPGIFTINAQGTGQGAVLGVNYRLVDSSNPTAANAKIQIYCTGLGAVTNQPLTGSPALASPLSETTTNPIVTIGGVRANMLFSGLSPGSVGLYQVNAIVPAGTATGSAVPVVISIGGVNSNSVTIAIQSPVSPNPQPSITGISPSSAQAGSGPLTLTITGSGFIPSSSVKFNGVLHTASFASSSQLIVTLSASDLAVAGTFPVLVTNPPPDGGNSNTVNFNVSSASVPTPPVPTGLSPGSAVPPGVTVSSLTPTLSWNASPGATGYVVAMVNNSTGAEILGQKIPTTSIISPTLVSGVTYVWSVAAFNSGGLGPTATLMYFTVAPIQTGLIGAWQGTWASSEYLGVFGLLSANLIQSGSTLTGTASFSGSPCFSGGTVAGTVSGSYLSASLDVGEGQTVSLSATINPTDTSINGSYTLTGGSCAPSGDSGTFSLSSSQ
jgi:uncharacterized protein (TIGR03437 family)